MKEIYIFKTVVSERKRRKLEQWVKKKKKNGVGGKRGKRVERKSFLPRNGGYKKILEKYFRYLKNPDTRI